jgi:hypothetical protein
MITTYLSIIATKNRICNFSGIDHLRLLREEFREPQTKSIETGQYIQETKCQDLYIQIMDSCNALCLQI